MKITEAEALTLFNTGHRVRLEDKEGRAPYGWNSIATGLFGLRSFYEYRNTCTAYAERYSMGVLHWVKPKPSSQTLEDALGHIYRREPFEIGNLSGTYAFVNHRTRGVLPPHWHAAFEEADYAVWSYQTPIAWQSRGGFIVMPPIRYSNTTTQHQHAVARALGVKGFSASDGSFRKGKGKTPFTSRSSW